MRTFFADTFYWVALTNVGHEAHKRALDLSRSLAPDRIITTDEVLCEYLAYFANARQSVRAKAGNIVAAPINLEKAVGLGLIQRSSAFAFDCG